MDNSISEIKEEKIKLIRTYRDGDLLSFIDEIRGKEYRAALNQFLDFFVPKSVKNIKSNAEKYGLKTRYNFLTFFKSNNLTSNKTNTNLDSHLQDLATKIYLSIYIIWVESQFGAEAESFSKSELVSDDFIDKIIEGCKQEKYPKEVVEKFYKFSPFINIDEKIELKISRLRYQYIDYIDRFRREQQIEFAGSERIEKLKKSNLESSRTINDLKNANTKLNSDKTHLLEENEILKKQNEELIGKVDSQTKRINEIYKENEELKNTNLQLQKEKKEIDNISNPLKMKESLEGKIEELNNIIAIKNNEIEDLKNQSQTSSSGVDIKNSKEYIELKQKFDKLANFRMQELDKKIQEDKKLQQILLSLILNNSTASKLVIKHLNLKEEVINEGYDYYDNEMIEKQFELRKLQQEIKNSQILINKLRSEKNNIISEGQTSIQNQAENEAQVNVSKYFKYDLKLKDADVANLFAGSDTGFVRKFISSEFVIMSEDKFRESFDFSNVNIPICDVIVEPYWHSHEDWFGKYENGIFHPAKTMVSDYYNFVKHTPDLPFGLIVFRNFNKILPEIYIQPFIEAFSAEGCFRLIHPLECKDGGDFAKIESLPNLKYIMLKTNDDNSFSIPKILEKYVI